MTEDEYLAVMDEFRTYTHGIITTRKETLVAEIIRLRALFALPASGLPNEEQYEREAALLTVEELRNAYVAARLLLDVKAWRVLGKSAVVEMEAGT